MPERAIGEKQLFYLEFINRENQVRHQTRDQDKLPYELLRDAKPQAVEAGMAAFRAHLSGQLSQDPLRSDQYYFVAGIALCCRYCMEGGLNEERAYNICDLYIQRMDTQQTREQLEDLYRDMLEFYLEEMTAVKKQRICSRPVAACMDYVYDHLYEQIRVSELAAHTGLNESYLSVLFKKETGMSISEYIRRRRVEAAEGMLRYSDYSCSDIGNYLAFCSQSHFISVFRKLTGLTPRQYRARYGTRKGVTERE